MTKKTVMLLSLLMFFATMQAGNDVMTKNSDGTYVVNTTTLCQTRGFKGKTPLEVYIKKGKVVKVVALPNKETPKFFNRVKSGLLSAWNGKKVSKAKKMYNPQNEMFSKYKTKRYFP